MFFQGTKVGVSLERKPGVFDPSPEDFNPVEFGRIRRQKVEKESFFFPGLNVKFKEMTPMNGGIIQYDDRRPTQDLGEVIKTANDRGGINGVLKKIRLKVHVFAQKAKDMNSLTFGRRQPHSIPARLPGIGNLRGQRKP